VHVALTNQATLALCVAALIVVLPGTRSGGRWLTDAAGLVPAGARAVVLGLVVPTALVYVLSTGFHPFLYFQF
jgi:hypothetical protein